MEKRGVSRRSFVAGSVAVGAGLAAGVAHAEEAEYPAEPDLENAPASFDPTGGAGDGDEDHSAENVAAHWWWEDAPAPILDEEISETLTADVVVVGMGNAGVMALLAAAEGGASVIGIEKLETPMVGANKMAFMNNISVTKAEGIEFTDDDRRKAVWELMKCGAERPDYRFYKQWMNDGGEFFDWLDTNVQEAGLEWEMHEWPYPEGYDVERENYKHYPCAVAVDTNGLLEHMKNKAVEMGSTQIFNGVAAVRLVRDDDNTGRVSAVIGKNAEGAYVKYVATKGVILATGEYSADKDMVAAYCPRVAYADISPINQNKGEGHRMAMWVGAQMEPDPHAPLHHAFTYGLLRCSAFLHVNAFGERFHNEDVSNPLWNEAVELNPGRFAWQVCDSNWQEYVPQMTPEYNSAWTVTDDMIEEMEDVHTEPAEEEPFTGISSWGVVRYKADTLEELAELMQVPVDTFVAEVERYNELAYAGCDTDYFRGSWRMFPIDTPPYYAGKNYVSAPLLILGGLVTDPITMQAYDADFNKIRGLYLAGNIVGRKFNVYYPGLAAGLALAQNRMDGWRAGQQVLLDDGGVA